jgi:phosphatidate cytidylyltransferase
LPPGFLVNLLRRTATALVALPLLLFAVLRGPAELAVAIAAVVVLLALHEFYQLLAARGLRPLRLTGLALTAAIFVEVALPGWQGAPFWPLAALLLLTATLLGGPDPHERVSSAAGTLLGAVYLGALGGTMAALRTLQPSDDGAWRVTLLLVVIMGSDALAFFVGHAFGRHRLAPRLSPGKTVEGALGGLAGGLLGALAVRAVGLPLLPVPHAVGLGALAAALGIVGDLVESLLKRWAGVKDSGALFPGHGGMLDRLDSLLFGAPVLYYYFNLAR